MVNICHKLITKTKCFHIISVKGKNFYCIRNHVNMVCQVLIASATAAALEQNQSLIFSIVCFWKLGQQRNPTHLKQYTVFQ